MKSGQGNRLAKMLQTIDCARSEMSLWENRNESGNNLETIHLYVNLEMVNEFRKSQNRIHFAFSSAGRSSDRNIIVSAPDGLTGRRNRSEAQRNKKERNEIKSSHSRAVQSLKQVKELDQWIKNQFYNYAQALTDFVCTLIARSAINYFHLFQVRTKSDEQIFRWGRR